MMVEYTLNDPREGDSDDFRILTSDGGCLRAFTRADAQRIVSDRVELVEVHRQLVAALEDMVLTSTHQIDDPIRNCAIRDARKLLRRL